MIIVVENLLKLINIMLANMRVIRYVMLCSFIGGVVFFVILGGKGVFFGGLGVEFIEGVGFLCVGFGWGVGLIGVFFSRL